MRAYERFLRYAQVYTTSDPASGTHPSTQRQFELARMLAQELKALGLADARVDEHCYVYASLAAAPGYENAPALGFIAHMDTVDDAPGEGVRPQLHPDYNGESLALGHGVTLDVERFGFLKALKGQTLITADGSTLLGADDKAGIAEIMTALERLQAEGLPHGKLCIGFTPDEEIGEGASLFDIPAFGAKYAYTVDGGDVGELEYQNFNAAAAVVSFRGFSVHPGSAKGLMVNAQNLAMEFHAALPAAERPEHTEGWQGFFHLTSMTGTVSSAKLGYIVRDHDKAKFAARKEAMQQIAAMMNEKYGEGTVTLELRDSYYNMEEKILPHYHLIENAQTACRMAGLEPVIVPIRGGTDGATLSHMGLPCPNLGTGGFNFHGPCECITAEKMDQATDVLVHLAALYAKAE